MTPWSRLTQSCCTARTTPAWNEDPDQQEGGKDLLLQRRARFHSRQTINKQTNTLETYQHHHKTTHNTRRVQVGHSSDFLFIFMLLVNNFKSIRSNICSNIQMCHKASLQVTELTRDPPRLQSSGNLSKANVSEMVPVKKR